MGFAEEAKAWRVSVPHCVLLRDELQRLDGWTNTFHRSNDFAVSAMKAIQGGLSNILRMIIFTFQEETSISWESLCGFIQNGRVGDGDDIVIITDMIEQVSPDPENLGWVMSGAELRELVRTYERLENAPRSM